MEHYLVIKSASDRTIVTKRKNEIDQRKKKSQFLIAVDEPNCIPRNYANQVRVHIASFNIVIRKRCIQELRKKRCLCHSPIFKKCSMENGSSAQRRAKLELKSYGSLTTEKPSTDESHGFCSQITVCRLCAGPVVVRH